MIKYIAKKDSWFKKGTEVKLIDDYRPKMDCGLFEGIRITKNPESEGGMKPDGTPYYPKGIERLDQEICSFDEFDSVET